ncbi:hypothetical protein Goari_011852 [Gossypium aridum]|uniref:Uncharacterized protein n=1 Tax=Gossypium aridum TaxID=34290 RepID=A0A7J8WZN8_GOSAI|nr:hypothetical protein [Gossypium aridum]
MSPCLQVLWGVMCVERRLRDVRSAWTLRRCG